MTKLKDIADHLNISVSTVSRVVNNKDRVDPKTREKILTALKEFNYYPNEFARSLKKNSSNVIGIIVPDITNIFFSTIIKAIDLYTRQKNYSIIFCNSDGDTAREKECLEILLHRKIAALIIATVNGYSINIQQYFKLKIPVVFIDNIPNINENFNSVTIDNYNASITIVKYLLENGHRRIYTLTGPLNETTAAERLEGWKAALAQAGVLYDEDWISVCNFKEESGYKATKAILSKSVIPTAIFAANNFMAYGAIKAILENGLRVPEDISVATFDAIDNTGLMQFKLTSIIQPANEIGKLAAEICIQNYQENEIRAFNKIILENELIIGNTTKDCLNETGAANNHEI